MNNYTEFNSKSFLIILFLICAVFLVLIIKAFSFIPDSNTDKVVSRNMTANTQKPRTVEQSVKEENNAVQEDAQVEQKTDTVSAVQDRQQNTMFQPTPNEQESLENIDELPQEASAENLSNSTTNTEPAAPSVEEQVLKIFVDAGKLKKDKQYVKAIEEYQKISTITQDTDTIAKSYEEIAAIYAIVKRYGTALSYAQKAYNMSPSSSREMLLARLYYKTGDMDKATRRINNVLQRDFSADR